MNAPENPKYSDQDLTFYAKALMEMSREVLPGDMRVIVLIVDGNDLKDRKLRTRMCSNMGTKLTEAVFKTASNKLGQVIPAKKHYSIQLQPGRFGIKY